MEKWISLLSAFAPLENWNETKNSLFERKNCIKSPEEQGDNTENKMKSKKMETISGKILF